ncbi:uncharacterized protein LOC116302518 [Actinia tenebrosa]|uniref:Uncharacterized protein LOC116302518 n=1 Tax=Actinia tenebrosa TaxID=6105 RepID=A0A6P8IL55_ACTTE|nr:uncharacterized protein LOC116302518 [Actinia tenebrosa]
MAEEEKPKSRRECLLCLLWFCCVLLTLAAFTFSMYTVKEFATLKARIGDLESQLSLISGNNLGYSEKDYMASRRTLPQSNKIWHTSKEDKKNKIHEINKRETQKPYKDRSNVFIHLSGGLKARRDRNLIKHLKV